MMVLIWCKLCSKHKSVILPNPLCKGSARKAIESYVYGTNFDSSNSSDSDSSSEFELDIDKLQQLFVYFAFSAKTMPFLPTLT